LARSSNWIVLILILCGCISQQREEQQSAATTDANPVVHDVAWRFDFVDNDENSFGFLTMVFTAERIDEPTCGNEHWKKMLILEDRLNFDFGVETRPAYTVHGPWLTIDLTASICYLDHNLIGDITSDGASGFFTFSHKIGGHNIGKFTARPVSTPRSIETTVFRR
jgi:hypothetical protein